MKKDEQILKAYHNLDFLNSHEARSIRILSELYEPQKRFKENNIVDTCVFFGSARLLSTRDAKKKLNLAKKEVKEKKQGAAKKLTEAEIMMKMAHYYDEAVELSKLLTEWSMSLPTEGHRFIVSSGGGPGIMEAANKGAFQAGGKSIGLNISIPFEQFVNKYVKNNLSFEFHYFFTRKFWFIYMAKALIVFPGGFGTLDEMMEVLTLIQTKKIKKDMKVIVYGEDFWKNIINFDGLIESGVISKNDMKLFDFCNTPEEAFGKIKTHFEKHYLSK
ncbi:MAG: TIGR00730 family Rossman fold protein [Melioribacteraceae bacterium]|nr:TIGR00730 family Rossman fold protein [Melioribacteraceae bacterium]